MIYCYRCHKSVVDVESAEFIPTPEIGIYAIMCKNCLADELKKGGE